MKKGYRIGIGHDVHALERGHKLMLGGVFFPDAEKGLVGHSDADVVCHAICDALLGAAALGDIGEHFPDKDPQWKDYPGGKFLENVARMIRDQDYEIVNIDCTVLCDVVKLGARKEKMAQTIASHLGVEREQINVKATTCEGHGAVGRGETIASESVALINTLT